tara:strand:+ start:134 stop:979 length:846 start_codon:yes stop_codon:yes gene_type:complete
MSNFDYKKWIIENKYGKTPLYSNYSSLNEQDLSLRKIRWKRCDDNTGPNEYYCVPEDYGEIGSTLIIYDFNSEYEVYIVESEEGCLSDYQQQNQPQAGEQSPGQIVGAGSNTMFDYFPYSGVCNSLNLEPEEVEDEFTVSCPEGTINNTENNVELCALGNEQLWYGWANSIWGIGSNWNAEGSYIVFCCNGIPEDEIIEPFTAPCDKVYGLPEYDYNKFCTGICPDESIQWPLDLGNLGTFEYSQCSCCRSKGPDPIKPKTKPIRGLKEIKNLIKKIIKNE